MKAKFRQIDEKGEILLNDLRAGRIDEATYAKKLRRLVARAERLLAKVA